MTRSRTRVLCGPSVRQTTLPTELPSRRTSKTRSPAGRDEARRYSNHRGKPGPPARLTPSRKKRQFLRRFSRNVAPDSRRLHPDQDLKSLEKGWHPAMALQPAELALGLEQARHAPPLPHVT